MLQLILQAIITLLLLTSTISFAAVGKITQQTGPMEIARGKQQLEAKVNSPVEMLDTITTAKSKAELTFEDRTTVKMTEQSKLIIDDFVYDPKQGAGKLSMKVALGTARYASGQIAKSNPQSVSIQTPTASIAVRGTDFSMTVDELGRSVIILLPSCDEKKKTCVTGAISVSTDAGEVFMDVAYQTTMVVSRDQPPSKPMVVAIDQANINNMMIISPPKEVADERIRVQPTELDKNELDQDLLKFALLDVNELDQVRELDINALDVDLLGDSINLFGSNGLDVQNKTLLANALEKNILPGYDESSGLRFFYNDDKSLVTLFKITTHSAYITFDTSENPKLILNQDGNTVTQLVNKGSGSTINIIQK